jgi:hypothetical protein
VKIIGKTNEFAQENEIEKSFVASKTSTFISWHDINFTVPVLNMKSDTINGGAAYTFVDPDDPRMTTLLKHNTSIRGA